MRTFTFLLALAAIAIPQRLVIADLIAHYEFDGNANDSVDDFNDGIEEGDAQPVDDGLFGGAYSFGTDQPPAGGVIVPFDVGADLIPDMTVTMWVRPDASILNAPGLYKVFGHDDGGWDRGFGLDNRQTGGYRYAAFNGAGITNNTGTPVTGEWTFLATVWDTEDEGDPLSSPATVTFYAGANSVTEPLSNGTGQLEAVIGAVRPDNLAETWRGLIDDVRIFDHALTIDEIDELRFFDRLDVDGDANDDGVVDLDDYALIQANAFQADPVDFPPVRQGDVNLDRLVDFTDFRIWKDNFAGAAPALVPEPAATSILWLALLMLCPAARRRAGAK